MSDLPMVSWSPRVLAAIAVIAACAFGGTATSAGAQSVGRVTLDGPATHITFAYPSCAGSVLRQVPGTVTTFDNRPLVGCKVTLLGRSGGSFDLCSGRGRIPARFQQSPRVAVRRGTSVACLPTATAAFVGTRAQCTHNREPGAFDSDGIRTFQYKFIRAYTSPNGIHHLHDFWARSRITTWTAWTRVNGVVCTRWG